MASKSLGTLTLDLIAKIGGYTGPLDKAERKTKDSTNNMARYAKNAGIALAGMGVAAAAGLTALVKSSIDTADQLSKSSKIVGIAIEDLSGLKHAADLSGVSFQGLETGLVKLNRSTQEAFEGVGAGADAYRALGISVKNTDGTLKSNYELLGEISDAFAGLEDGALKTSLAQDLLGKSGAKLIPLLNGGSKGLQSFREEAERLGLVIDEKTGTASEEFNDNMARLQKTLVGLGNTIAADVAPELADLTKALADPQTQEGIANLTKGFIELTKQGAGFFSEFGNLGNQIAINLASATGNLAEADKIVQEIKDIDRALAGGLSTPLRYLFTSEEELKTLREEKQAILDAVTGVKALKEDQKPIVSARDGFTEYNNSGIDSEINAQLEQRFKIQADLYQQADELNETFSSYEASYIRQIELASDATEIEKLRFEIANGSLQGINEKQRQRLEDLARERDLQIEALELERELESVQGDLMSEEERYASAAAERAAVLNEARNAGLISEQEYGRLIEANTEKLGEQIDKLKEKTDEMDEFTKNAARSIQGELSDALVNGFEGGSDDILKRWGKLIQRLIADAVAADLTRALFGQDALGGNGGQYGTAQLISGIGGLFAGFFDSGGRIPDGKFGIVGEYGPELVAGPATVTGRKDTAAMMAGSSVGNITINMPGVTNAQEARKAAGAAGRELLAIINGAQRYT